MVDPEAEAREEKKYESVGIRFWVVKLFLSLLEEKWEEVGMEMAMANIQPRFCLQSSFIDLTVLLHSTEMERNLCCRSERIENRREFHFEGLVSCCLFFGLHTSFARVHSMRLGT